jgi:tRNA(Arg) A34 adenosine deaminase TadA
MDGNYPWRDKQKRAKGGYVGGDYLGHNIACLAVDAEGEVIDFDFNHNEILSSSVEHAESRLIRRIFSLAQIGNGWATRDITKPAPAVPYSNLLSDVTIYTSLESCSQCSGIMALGAVRSVVFLQRDPAQFSIGNVLRNLSPANSNYRPPLPIPANYVGIPHFDELNKRYDDYVSTVRDRPFYVNDGGQRFRSETVTSFLCTDSALEVFQDGQAEFDQLEHAQFPDFKPSGKDGQPFKGAKSNEEVIDHIRHFFYYAASDGRRGTPHKL